ncbi:hypothetical protein DM01DRAFT_323411 [Hesseltinella vesiculosa]|uniref:YABBY protein C-terminal domain-containing protein n=1 Tax=Hesseltinella vesiculosa TaxID=101127 RepID=A0A1X2GRV1_9FUNG|nr:hypothetical protein DM01DRAFT_323411 [Hesseltinella vesiculosa]
MAKVTAKKTTKKPTLYNIFMKDELAKIKKDKPGMNHKEAFKLAAANWSKSPQNPKTKK